MGFWATWTSCRCPCSLLWGWTIWLLRVPSNSNDRMILQFYGTAGSWKHSGFWGTELPFGPHLPCHEPLYFLAQLRTKTRHAEALPKKKKNAAGTFLAWLDMWEHRDGKPDRFPDLPCWFKKCKQLDKHLNFCVFIWTELELQATSEFP